MRPFFDESACPDRPGPLRLFPTIHRPIIAAVDDAAAGLDLVQSLHELQLLMDGCALALVAGWSGNGRQHPEHFAADRLLARMTRRSFRCWTGWPGAGANLADDRPFARRDGQDRGESRRACDAGGGDPPDAHPRSSASTAPTTAPPSSPRCSARRQRSRAVRLSAGGPCQTIAIYRRRDLGLAASDAALILGGRPDRGLSVIPPGRRGSCAAGCRRRLRGGDS